MERIKTSNYWQDGDFLPLIIRTRKLPAEIGTKSVECSHGEVDAMNILYEMVPTNLPLLIVMDSSHVRKITTIF